MPLASKGLGATRWPSKPWAPRQMQATPPSLHVCTHMADLHRDSSLEIPTRNPLRGIFSCSDVVILFL